MQRTEDKAEPVDWPQSKRKGALEGIVDDATSNPFRTCGAKPVADSRHGGRNSMWARHSGRPSAPAWFSVAN